MSSEDHAESAVTPKSKQHGQYRCMNYGIVVASKRLLLRHQSQSACAKMSKADIVLSISSKYARQELPDAVKKVLLEI